MRDLPAGLIRVPDRLYDGYIFDLDGTVYLGDRLLPGVRRLIRELRERGKRVVFVSNNATRDPRMYSEKLAGFGLPTPEEEVVNTVVTMTRWLSENHPDATVFPIGEEPLKTALRGVGIKMSENPEEVDIVIASFDRAFDYRKLQIAFDAIWYHGRARLVTTNPDRYCPLPGGRGEPDAAAIVAAIEACTGTRCEANTGKPGRIMLETAIEVMGIGASECMVTGDRLYTDVRMALDAGMPSAVVLTGETIPEMLGAAGETEPDYVLDRIDRLMPPWGWRELGWTDEEG